MADVFRIRNTIKYPTSLIINGGSSVALEVAESLLEQGGYVILVDVFDQPRVERIQAKLGHNSLLTLVDYTAIPHLEEDIRRLDYVFYFHNEERDLEAEVSTQDFLKYSNYLDTTLALSVKFDAKFLLATSWKAHRLLMELMDVQMDYSKQIQSRTTAYTQMEVQRYAESLTLEYVAKANLNARVLRMGEIIGQGTDFSVQSAFTQLVIAAVSGMPLKIPGDGLEMVHYVHVLDAAYAVVKAQFTKDTVGNMYSVAYEQGVTHLSLAYKLQELEPAAGEISFDRDSISPPAPHLHKPAPSLMHIGWRPSIDFDQAIKDSLAAAKAFLLVNPMQPELPAAEPNTILGKIQSFLKLAQAPEAISETEAESGPVSRLISERRRQAEARDYALQKAQGFLRQRERRRVRTLPERINSYLWNKLTALQGVFGFLKNITPAQFFLYTVLTVVFAVLYFAVISPTFVFVRNTLIVYDNIQQFETALSGNDLVKAAAASDVFASAMDENLEILRSTRGSAKLLALDSFAGKLDTLLSAYVETSSGMRNIMYALEPFAHYMQNYESNLSYRPSTNSYLAVGLGRNYEELLAQLSTRKAYVSLGTTQLKNGLAALRAADVGVVPQFLQPQLARLNTRLFEYADDFIGYADIANYAADILGSEGTSRHYLLLLMDNSRPMPIGGSLSAYAYLSMQNGSFADVQVQPIENLNLPVAQISDFALQQINLHTYSPKQKNSLSLNDLGRIGDPEIYSDVIKGLWKTATNTQIDGIVMLNLNSLERWLDVTGAVQVDLEQVDSASLLRSLSSLQASTPTLARRHDILTQILAQLIQRSVAEPQVSLLAVMQALATSAANKELVVSNSDLAYNRAVSTYGIHGKRADFADFAVQLYLVGDAQIISPVRYPSLDQSTVARINADGIINMDTFYVKLAGADNIDEVIMCVPITAESVNLRALSGTRARRALSGSQQCEIIDVISETELSFSWRTLPLSSGSNLTDLNIGIAKVIGASVRSGVELTIAPDLTLEHISPPSTIVGGKVGFTEPLVNDHVVELKFK